MPKTVTVALRKESVDRNFCAMQIVVIVVVALRKESVDRNLVGGINRAIDIMSLSARRAWIEMRVRGYPQCPYRSRSPQGERG